jgi:hypothetical protein
MNLSISERLQLFALTHAGMPKAEACEWISALPQRRSWLRKLSWA